MAKGRVCILMMDSLGIGASEDAALYGDEQANTLGHILEKYPQTKLPHLSSWGLLKALEASSGIKAPEQSIKAYYGYAVEQSKGKDTPSGHWEMMGVPVLFDWGYFPNPSASFPKELIQKFIKRTGIADILGNCHASGTQIIDELAEQHIKTGFPIVYTSADSVLQIAAHEQYFGLQRLYEICEIARDLVDEYKIGRVIARPFLGEAGHFYRTSNRKDYTTPPYKPTLLDQLKRAGHPVLAIGKIADIFAHQGISQVYHGENNQDLFEISIDLMKTAAPGSLIFTNFVDFDSKYGHRRDIEGYAKALEAFDTQLGILESILNDDDLVFIVADHGCDPSLPGSDHTREHIPVLMYQAHLGECAIGRRSSFADVGQTIASYFNLDPLDVGTSFLASKP